MTDNKRKGARSANDIPKDMLGQLNRGELETANLTEWLAVDQHALLQYLLHQYNREKYLMPILGRVNELKKQTVNTVNEAIGCGLGEQATVHGDHDLLYIISTHRADLVRCWAAYTMVGSNQQSIRQTLESIKPFAADHHFGVREIAWMAVRQNIAENLDESIAILSEWTSSNNDNVRRFASEATRPRGVWCGHIERLKQNPGLGLPILDPLKSDTARYVQDSVGNWLNDAGKTQPEFVKQLCKRWEKESDTKETKYIIKRASRTIDK